MKTIRDLEKIYEIDFEKIISEIKSKKCKLVLLQFADGLKPYATAVVDYLEEKTAPKGVHQGGARTPKRGETSSRPRNISGEMFTRGNVDFLIWLGDCFGACDTPVLGEELCTARCTPNCGIKGQMIDLVVQVGHNSLQPKI